MGGYQSGQMGQTVNLLAQPSEVRILLPPQIRWLKGEIAKLRNGEMRNFSLFHHFTIFFAEVAHLVERKPSKLQVAGSSPVFRSLYIFAFVAQG